VRWDPFRELENLQGSISKLYDENLRHFRKHEGTANQLAFPVDIKYTPESVLIKAELPGMNKDDIKVTFSDNILTIQAERSKEEKEEGVNYVRTERSYGSFSRSFTVDVPVKQGDVKASYQEGVLEITMPKEKVEKKEEVSIKVE
jgi:HSP20 family protein